MSKESWITEAVRRDAQVARRYRKSYGRPSAANFYRALSVEVRPGAQVVLNHPDDPFVVEVQYQDSVPYRDAHGRQIRPHSIGPLATTLMAMGRRGGAEVTDVRLHAKEGQVISLSPGSLRYFWRYLLAASTYAGLVAERTGLTAVPRRRQAGTKGMSYDDYLELLSAYEALSMLPGERAPARVLAESYGVKRSTMRTWIHRARNVRAKYGHLIDERDR